jgi:hypothetical protein
MSFKINDSILVRDMFMMLSYYCRIVSIVYFKHKLHLILTKDEKYSLGQVYFIKKDNQAISEIRATSWHNSIDELNKYWTITESITNEL